MLEAYVEIIGTRPLLFNRFGPDSIPLVKAERTGVAGNDPEEWTRRICWNEKRQLYLEAPAVFASIRDGGIYTKKGRGSIQPLIVATLQVEFDSDRPLPSGRLGAERPVRPCLSRCAGRSYGSRPQECAISSGGIAWVDSDVSSDVGQDRPRPSRTARRMHRCGSLRWDRRRTKNRFRAI
jgi:hypothetical protein